MDGICQGTVAAGPPLAEKTKENYETAIKEAKRAIIDHFHGVTVLTDLIWLIEKMRDFGFTKAQIHSSTPDEE